MIRAPAPPLPPWLERLLPFERSTVRVGGEAMHLLEAGRGRPVLLLHGNPTWSFLYRKVMTALAQDELRLIAPDLIGLGFSSKPRSMSWHTLDRHAELLGDLIDGLDLDRLILVVQDWGGPIGLRAFADPARRARLAGLVVMNTAVSPPKPNFSPTLFHRFAATPVASDVSFRLLGFPQNILRFAQGDRGSIRGEVARAYRYPLRHLRDRAAPLALARLVPDSLDHPSIPALRRCQEVIESFRGPSSIVWGDRDPVLGRVRTWIERLLPEAEVTRTEAGHFLQEEVPDAIAAAIRSVARRLG